MTKRDSASLKGVAIVLMLIHHLFGEKYWQSFDMTTIFLSQKNWIFLSSTGKICVAIFVFISAFGMTKSLSRITTKTDTREYITRRYIKVIMPFLFIYLLSAILAVCTNRWVEVYGADWKITGYYVLLDALGLASVLGTPTLNVTWWYMSYAVLLIVLIPLINKIIDKFGAVAGIIAGILIPIFMNLQTYNTLLLYMLPVCLGVICARTDIFDKMKELSKLRQSVLYVVLFITLGSTVYIRFHYGCYWLVDGVISFAIVPIIMLFSKLPVIPNVFAFLGKHSMNIFLTHTFIFYYYLKEQLYSCKYPIVILLVLLLSSLLISIAIEAIKKLVRFHKLEEYLLKKI